ncbi:glycosyltransferase family 39 protein [Azohydromonas caseinilytica]|uniref:Glycosyltransferase RgtA/B/C/D-like domain-containing protein n=1 Tax=Azohydromonas caseinilytica TaxID=2728836 RepID=A0A848FFA1_9BURK|nr:glycosyltransferase family 39 protein [Azohydromonas caseinilytica]NML17515.1 hypothetical protein [Azohydromonas caseinilytica]
MSSTCVTEHPPRHGRSAATPVIVLALLLFPVLSGDHQGFEGDGLAMLFGMSQFDSLGRAGVYRYHWQPLSYELLSALYPLLDRPFSLAYVAQLFGGAALALLYLLLTRIFKGVAYARGLALALTLCLTELWVTTLYFNTTALALPFITAGLLLAHRADSSRRPAFTMVLAGMATGLGCLFRLDFLAMIPAALVLQAFWTSHNPIRRALLLIAGGILVALAFLAWQPDFIQEAAAILRLYGQGEHDVNLLYRLKIILFSMGPALVVLPLLWWACHQPGPGLLDKRQTRLWILLGLALLPTLAPLKNLYSGKYLIPFFLCLVVALAQALARAAQGRSRSQPQALMDSTLRTGVTFSLGILAGLLLFGIPAPSSLKQRPLTAWAESPLIVGTHDGARSAGAYLSFLKQIENFEVPQNSVLFYKQLAELVNGCQSDLTVVMSPVPRFGQNVWSWGWLPLYLTQSDWQLLEYDAGKEARLRHPVSGRQVRILSSDQRAAVKTPGVLDLGLIGNREDYAFWSAGLSWLHHPATQAICMRPASALPSSTATSAR